MRKKRKTTTTTTPFVVFQFKVFVALLKKKDFIYPRMQINKNDFFPPIFLRFIFCSNKIQQRYFKVNINCFNFEACK